MLTQMKLAALKAFSLFGVDIYWYGIIIVSGMAVAIAFGCYLTKYRKVITQENVLDAALFVIPLGVLGARLFYVISDGTSWTFLEFFTRPGGLSILGGVIGGSVGVFLVSAIKKLDSLSLRDVLVPCVLLAQAIGRWGNFLNQEVYGYPVTNPDWQWFPFAVNINGTYHHALFFYEFLVNLIGAILLFTLLKKVKIKGVVGFTYFLWYGFWRAILEGMRMHEYILGIDEFMASRFVSIIFALIGIAGIVYLTVKDKKQKALATAHEKGILNEDCLGKNDEQYSSEINEEGQERDIIPENPAQVEPKTRSDKIASLVAELDEFDREIEKIECDIASIEEAIAIEPNTLSEGDIARLSKELDDIERSLITVRSASSIKKQKPQVKKAAVKKSSNKKAPATAKTPTTAKRTTKTKNTTSNPIKPK